MADGDPYPDRMAGVVSLNTPHVPHWDPWLHPEIVRPALGTERTFAADPKPDPIAQMREVYSPDMCVLMFVDGDKAECAMNANSRGAIRSAYGKDLMRSSELDPLPLSVAHMEYWRGSTFIVSQKADGFFKQPRVGVRDG